MRTDITNEAPRRRAMDQRAAATHHRAAQCHEAAVKIHSEVVVFFRSLGQEGRADRERRLVAAHLAAATSERKLAASHWGAAAQREGQMTIGLPATAGGTKIGTAPR